MAYLLHSCLWRFWKSEHLGLWSALVVFGFNGCRFSSLISLKFRASWRTRTQWLPHLWRSCVWLFKNYSFLDWGVWIWLSRCHCIPQIQWLLYFSQPGFLRPNSIRLIPLIFSNLKTALFVVQMTFFGNLDFLCLNSAGFTPLQIANPRTQWSPNLLCYCF